MNIKYKSDNYNALNYYIHTLKHKSYYYYFKEHFNKKELKGTRITL